MFTLYADAQDASTHSTKAAAVAAGRASGAESFEVWDEQANACVATERPFCQHVRY